MSKRLFPQHLGDRKKAKLDISISDHNFPLSQNKEPDHADTWGDDNDDEILLLASQACEEAYNGNDISLLPDYSMFMQPGSSSTQMFSSPGPSTSKTEFTFKKPSANPPTTISTNLREKCNRIASPLPGITANVMPKANEPLNFSDDLIFKDISYKGQDADYIYRQLLNKIQEENAKLKSENGKLLEKCVTKEGEASILRTQLKTSQMAVDNARLEKIKAQEKVQIEWTEKLASANTQMHDLRTQLDFKNLEIISIKEKCKKLESSKVKVTQVMVANNDISSSCRPSSSFAQNDSMMQRKVKTSSNAVQTDEKTHFMALNTTCRTVTSPLPSLLPLLLQPTDSPHSLLDYNEKLTHTDVPYKCRMYSTFHKEPSVPERKQGKNQLVMIYVDILKIASGDCDRQRYFNVFNVAGDILRSVVYRLETISQRMSSAFQREMDEKYIEATASFIHVSKEDLLKGGALYKEEQEILARRMTAILSYILESSSGADLFNYYEQSTEREKQLTECIYRICTLLDTTSTAILHSGLLLSITHVIRTLKPPKTLDIIRAIISSRPMPAVSCELLALVREVSLWDNFRKHFCPGSSMGNLKMDYDQGVLLYKKENCHLQILLKQVEGGLQRVWRQQRPAHAQRAARRLLALHCALFLRLAGGALQEQGSCDCQLVLLQVIVYALWICAVMLQNRKSESNGERGEAARACACGVQLLYQCSLRDAELGARLAHYEGLLVEFCELVRGHAATHSHANMLSELASTLQSSPEDMPPSFHRQAWLKSFETFSMTD